MKTVFIGKNRKPYSISDLEICNILHNSELLALYSMEELHELYKEYYGNYTHNYPYILAKKIEVYDSSDAVNGFNFKGNNVWLDKATRVGLMHLANCSTESIQLILGDQILTFTPDQVKEFLARLEVYAGQCYVQTQKHLLEVKKLKTTEDLLNYDFTTGYPEKLTLE